RRGFHSGVREGTAVKSSCRGTPLIRSRGLAPARLIHVGSLPSSLTPEAPGKKISRPCPRSFTRSGLEKSHSVLHCRGRVLGLERPVVMGVLNVTPDSFSDGGR